MPPKKAQPSKSLIECPSLKVRSSNESFQSLEECVKFAQDMIPPVPEMIPPKLRQATTTLDSSYHIQSWTPDAPLSNLGTLTCRLADGTVVQRRAYRKMIPLLTPYRWMRYGERPSEPFHWTFQTADITSPTNQAYIDAMASSLVSQFKIPHICQFYGAYRGRADVHFYNLEDDLEEFRFTRWFWSEIEKGSFGLRIIEKSTGRRLTLDEIKELLKPDEEHLTDDEDEQDSEEDSGSGDELSSVESLEDVATNQTSGLVLDALEEIDDLGSIDSDVVQLQPKQMDKDAESEESEESYSDDYFVHAELYNMPVVILYLEAMEGVMDDLLNNVTHSETHLPSPEDEEKWSAWLFQIVITLAHFQRILNLTHNDLHTNNVTWKDTKEPFIQYKDTTGMCWKIPTYGKIFQIIDYGRAIFTLQGYTLIGSDYEDGHDAAGQYNFGRIQDFDLPKCLPNKSFDLSRLACSLLRALYPTNPEAKPKGRLLSKDGSLCVYETKHDLFNLLWTWTTNQDKESILEDENGEEKYPGFELYVHIAGTVKDAVPSVQLSKKLFSKYLVSVLDTKSPIVYVSI